MHTIYTYGYAGTDPATLAAHLERLGALLIDIRYRPASRDARWSKASLERQFTERYTWEQALGNPNYNTDGPMALYQPERAVGWIGGALQERPVIVLCACRNVQHCHRLLAAEYLQAHLGVSIEHLAATPSTAAKLPALTMWQPHASLVAWEEKRIETRSWATPYRGPLVIHAAKHWTPSLARLCQEPLIGAALDRHQVDVAVLSGTNAGNLPLGAALCVVELVDCVPISPASVPPDPEAAFGFYDVNMGPRWAWHLAAVQRFPTPIPMRGFQGLWDARELVMAGQVRYADAQFAVVQEEA